MQDLWQRASGAVRSLVGKGVCGRSKMQLPHPWAAQALLGVDIIHSWAGIIRFFAGWTQRGGW